MIIYKSKKESAYMIKYYYASIIDKNMYLDDINLIEYLKNFFPIIYKSYQNMFNKSILLDFNRYKEERINFSKKITEEGISPYLLLKKEKGELREIHTNTPLTYIQKPKLKELSAEEVTTLYNKTYQKKINRYIYLPAALDNNPIFDLDYDEKRYLKHYRKQTRPLA